MLPTGPLDLDLVEGVAVVEVDGGITQAVGVPGVEGYLPGFLG